MEELIDFYPFKIFIGILIFVLGGVIGSFSLCIAERYGTNDKSKKSHCTSCGRALTFLELIPILSYVFLKGKCKNCGAKIGKKSIVVEVLSAITYLVIFIRYGFSLLAIFGLIIFPILLIPALIDLRLMIIPNLYPALLILLWIPYLLLISGPLNVVNSLLGGILIPLLIFILSLILGKILKKETFGMGDLKILIGIGPILGFYGSFINVFIMSIIGIIMAFIMKKGRGEAFALMPAICVSTIITYVFGNFLEDACINLF